MKVPHFYLYLSLQFLSHTLIAQTFTISGFIKDAETGEILSGANIWEIKSQQGTLSNNFGFFSLSIPGDTISLLCSFVGYQTDTISLYLGKDEKITAILKPSVYLNTVEIGSKQNSTQTSQTQMGFLKLSAKEIERLPSLLGETDLMRTLQLLPGIQSGTEGQTGLYVRGGSPDQNLILLDGVTVYNASHLFGFFSVFNIDAINEVNITKGGFPARYGGRLSSVIDISMKEGNAHNWKGTGSLGLIASKFMVEGPIKKDTTSFIISGRRTYFDILAKPFIQQSFNSEDIQGDVGYFFYDLNAKINHRFSDKDRLFLSMYNGHDNYRRKELTDRDTTFKSLENRLGWGNFTMVLRWNHLWSNKLFSNTTLTYSQFDFETLDDQVTSFTKGNRFEKSAYQIAYQSGITDVAIRQDFDFTPNPRHFMRFGGQLISHLFRPGNFEQLVSINTNDRNFERDTIIGQTPIDALEWMGYWEDEFYPSSKVSLNVGIHYSGYLANGATFHSFQPRLSFRYEFNNQLAVKASFAQMRQYTQLLTNSTVGLPTDLWLPTTKRVQPQDAWQGSLGISKTYKGRFETSLEVYYKAMNNVLAYKPGTSLFDFNDWQDRIIQGKGQSYGLELFLKKSQGNWTAWFAYTLSWSWRKFSELNDFERFPFKYDRRHDLSITTAYNLTKTLELSGTWAFGTGHALTLPKSHYSSILNYTANSFIAAPAYDFGKRNDFRTPAFHRLDISLNLHKQKKKYKEIWSIGLYNAYSRRNPFYLQLSIGEIVGTTANGAPVRKSSLNQVSLFPMLPSFMYKIIF